MSGEPNSESPDPSKPSGDAGAYSQQIQHAPVGARLPDRVAPGTFSTGVIVMEGPEEFVLDFVQRLQRPPRLAVRVIMSPNVMSRFVAALKDNLQRFEQAFGPPKPLPQPHVERRPSIQEIYQELRLPDDLLSGVYANTVMVGHSPAEFFFDFITRFFPTAAVSARVYLAASQVPQMLVALNTSLQNRLGRGPDAKKEPPPTPESEQP
jgi:hypothetical protein